MVRQLYYSLCDVWSLPRVSFIVVSLLEDHQATFLWKFVSATPYTKVLRDYVIITQASCEEVPILFIIPVAHCLEHFFQVAKVAPSTPKTLCCISRRFIASCTSAWPRFSSCQSGDKWHTRRGWGQLAPLPQIRAQSETFCLLQYCRKC